MKLNPVDRYNAIMTAATMIALDLYKEKEVAKPSEQAVTLALEIESHILNALEIEQ